MMVGRWRGLLGLQVTLRTMWLKPQIWKFYTDPVIHAVSHRHVGQYYYVLHFTSLTVIDNAAFD